MSAQNNSTSLHRKLDDQKHTRMYAFDRDSKGVSPLVAANRKFAQNTSHEFFAKQKHSKLKNVQGCTFLSRGLPPKARI